MPDTVQRPLIVRKRHESASEKPDRRVERTLSALLQAFIALMLGGQYRTITIGRIVERANVGRSTFYDHFRTKDDILLASMDWMFKILADAVDAKPPLASLGSLVDHFWSNRQLAKVVLAPPVDAKLQRALTARIEARLIENAQGRANGTECRIAAIQIASGQLALLSAWTKGAVSAEPDQVVQGLCRIARI